MLPADDRLFIRRLLIGLLLGGGALLLWQAVDVLLLLFGSILVAVILRSVAAPVEAHTPLSSPMALAAAIVLILSIIALAIWIAGNAVQNQIDELSQKIPQAWHQIRSYLQGSRIGSHVANWIQNVQTGGMLSGASRATAAVMGSLVDLVLVVFGGVYLAARPNYYFEGTLKLVPARSRDSIAETLKASGHALQIWLKGQLIAMIAVGLLIALGLWLIGMPSALALGLIAGLGEFIPIVGTLLAITPALLLALAQTPQMVLWTIAVFFVVQQLEGNVIVPLIQQYMVYLPPVLTLFSLMVFTLLFGPLGLLFAAPMTVVAYVAIKKLYIRDALETPTPIPGERH